MAIKYQPLLVRCDTFLVLDVGFDTSDGVTGVSYQGNDLTHRSPDIDFHACMRQWGKERDGVLSVIITAAVKMLASTKYVVRIQIQKFMKNLIQGKFIM